MRQPENHKAEEDPFANSMGGNSSMNIPPPVINGVMGRDSNLSKGSRGSNKSFGIIENRNSDPYPPQPSSMSSISNQPLNNQAK